MSLFICSQTFGQHSDESSRIKQLNIYQDSLASLGKKIVNDENDLERKNANYQFIKTLVSALKINNSFLFPFDSVKNISILNSPDNRFRIMSWHVMNQDGSYRFYGTIQLNSGGPLKMFPLEDYSPLLKNPEDSVTDNRKWYGAQYYKIIPVYAQKPYYVLLGWKGNTVKSTKKVLEILSFNNGDKPTFGMPVFDGNGKSRKRVIFEYTRQVSMLLRYVSDQNLIVFDHLAPPDKKMKDQPETFGPDLTYDGYKLKNGRWVYVENLDMRNIPSNSDAEYVDPKKQAAKDKSLIHSN
ncbi:hypothetical protein G7092_25340 [Mucilaginibacter sp. HC2]|nr:hypothetical protein [Mucilaginibacter inviolabilis]